MNFTYPLAIGVTNAHWVKVVLSHLSWAHYQEMLDDSSFNSAKEAISSLSSGTPEPSFTAFKERAMKIVPEPAGKVLLGISEKIALNLARSLVVKENNEVAIRSYYAYRDSFKELAYKYERTLQLFNKQITSVGYQIALFYNNFKELLEKITHARRYVEIVNSDSQLSSFAEIYSVEELDFIAKELELFNVTTFSNANQNWFISSARDIASLTKGIVNYFGTLLAKGHVEFEANFLTEAISASDAILSFNISSFELSYEAYTSLFIQVNNTLSSVNKIISTVRFNTDAIEAEVTGIQRSKYTDAIPPLFARIFDGERKREVFEEIFCEAPEVDNMILRLAQQLNNEYRNSTKPVCCVGFTEGCIILLGKIFPLLNFPCHMVTARCSFYGAATSGDESKDIEIEFDNSKYDGKRVIVFDDILDRGITVKKFLAQAREKTKAIDFKVCMLFAKPNPENVYGDADYLGYMLPNVWVVGYGFDTLFKHRNADAVGSIKEQFKKE